MLLTTVNDLEACGKWTRLKEKGKKRIGGKQLRTIIHDVRHKNNLWHTDIEYHFVLINHLRQNDLRIWSVYELDQFIICP